MTIFKKPVGMAGATLQAEHVSLNDFTDENYKAMKLLKDPQGAPVVICHSISGVPKRYRIIHGRNTTFYLNYSDVLDYCTKNKCKLINGGY